MFNEDGTLMYCTCGKVCYTEAEAGRFLNVKKYGHSNLRTRHMISKGKNTVKRKYKCNICNWWHLTHYANKRSGRKWK